MNFLSTQDYDCCIVIRINTIGITGNLHIKCREMTEVLLKAASNTIQTHTETLTIGLVSEHHQHSIHRRSFLTNITCSDYMLPLVNANRTISA